ncbi:MAG: hypothetical protein IJ451_07085 [Ruminococcus sp.]|nr:hypothetical protein [Ruminococcus sp.]
MKANKRILCVILALIMCVSTTTIAVAALGYPDSFNLMYKELVFDALDWDLNPDDYVYSCEYAYNADGTTPDKGETPDFILAFANHDGVVHDMVIDTEIGGYRFTSGCSFFPYYMGYFIYSFKEHKCYSLEEAWDAQLPQTETVLAMLGTPVQKLDQTYKDIVFEVLGDEINFEYQQYRYIYSYNADGSTVDEGEIPDYILAWTGAGGADAIVERVIGDYYFISGAILNPFDLGYCICSTKENKCYSLDEAWDVKLPNIEIAFAKAGTHVDETNNDLTKYRTKIISKLGWENTDEDIKYRCIAEYTADGTEAIDGATADYAVIFAHQGAWTEEAVYSIIGNYRLKVSNDFKPGYIIYSLAEDKIYTIREAYNEDLPCMDLAMEKIGTKVRLYAEVFEKFLEPYKEDGWEDLEGGWYGYDELYYYSYQKRHGSIESFEITPDYVLIEGSTYFADPMLSYDVFGDYIVYGGCGFPNCSNYYIYTPKDGKLYTLREAYDAGVKEIEKVFTDYGLGVLKGDADGDRKLTVKDATYIQKCLAKIDGFEFNEEIRGHHLSVEDDGSPDINVVNIEDFDNNDKVDIKDATAIQKRLANIE